jgi:hypothetical protein
MEGKTVSGQLLCGPRVVILSEAWSAKKTGEDFDSVLVKSPSTCLPMCSLVVDT